MSEPQPKQPRPEPPENVMRPLDHFRHALAVDYARLCNADKAVVGRYFKSFQEGRELLAAVKLLQEAFGVSGMGPMEMPPGFWEFADKDRGMAHVVPNPPKREVAPAPAEPKPRVVTLGLEFFTASNNIDYDRLADEDKAILGRWFKSCPEGEEIHDRIQARVDRQLELNGKIEGIGFVLVPFSFWHWLYEERKRMQAAARAEKAAA